jgi:hypothetical protein
MTIAKTDPEIKKALNATLCSSFISYFSFIDVDEFLHRPYIDLKQSLKIYIFQTAFYKNSNLFIKKKKFTIEF